MGVDFSFECSPVSRPPIPMPTNTSTQNSTSAKRNGASGFTQGLVVNPALAAVVVIRPTDLPRSETLKHDLEAAADFALQIRSSLTEILDATVDDIISIELEMAPSATDQQFGRSSSALAEADNTTGTGSGTGSGSTKTLGSFFMLRCPSVVTAFLSALVQELQVHVTGLSLQHQGLSVRTLTGFLQLLQLSFHKGGNADKRVAALAHCGLKTIDLRTGNTKLHSELCNSPPSDFPPVLKKLIRAFPQTEFLGIDPELIEETKSKPKNGQEVVEQQREQHQDCSVSEPTVVNFAESSSSLTPAKKNSALATSDTVVTTSPTPVTPRSSLASYEQCKKAAACSGSKVSTSPVPQPLPAPLPVSTPTTTSSSGNSGLGKAQTLLLHRYQKIYLNMQEEERRMFSTVQVPHLFQHCSYTKRFVASLETTTKQLHGRTLIIIKPESIGLDKIRSTEVSLNNNHHHGAAAKKRSNSSSSSSHHHHHASSNNRTSVDALDTLAALVGKTERQIRVLGARCALAMRCYGQVLEEMNQLQAGGIGGGEEQPVELKLAVLVQQDKDYSHTDGALVTLAKEVGKTPSILLGGGANNTSSLTETIDKLDTVMRHLQVCLLRGLLECSNIIDSTYDSLMVIASSSVGQTVTQLPRGGRAVTTPSRSAITPSRTRSHTPTAVAAKTPTNTSGTRLSSPASGRKPSSPRSGGTPMGQRKNRVESAMERAAKRVEAEDKRITASLQERRKTVASSRSSSSEEIALLHQKIEELQACVTSQQHQHQREQVQREEYSRNCRDPVSQRQDQQLTSTASSRRQEEEEDVYNDIPESELEDLLEIPHNPPLFDEIPTTNTAKQQTQQQQQQLSREVKMMPLQPLRVKKVQSFSDNHRNQLAGGERQHQKPSHLPPAEGGSRRGSVVTFLPDNHHAENGHYSKGGDERNRLKEMGNQNKKTSSEELLSYHLLRHEEAPAATTSSSQNNTRPDTRSSNSFRLEERRAFTQAIMQVQQHQEDIDSQVKQRMARYKAEVIRGQTNADTDVHGEEEDLYFM